MARLIIQATNVHQGGGRALLSALLAAVPGDCETVALLDRRMVLPENMPAHIEVKTVEPSVIQRLGAERWLKRNAKLQDLVLCFGNLPPLFRLPARVVVFVQNRYLIDNVKLDGFPLKVRLRLTVERVWMSGRIANAGEFVVQTATMQNLLRDKTQGRAKIRVLPFVAEPAGYERGRPQPEGRRDDFVYVASGEPHKNHRRLLEAWRLLAEEGLFPSLCLTLEPERFAGLCREIDIMRERHSVRVNNMTGLSHRDVLALYRKAGAAIYPSTFESFGLPLIEARQAGLPVLASELDYVRDVLDPEQTFDPYSAISIARAVKRFIGVEEQPLPLLDGRQFVAAVLANGE